MPLFEFVCRACGHRFESVVIGSHTPTCPVCESTELEKLVSSFGTRISGERHTTRAASPFA